ncbi:MAG: hypothetical protein V9G14_19290 [Cypionkella sp.]
MVEYVYNVRWYQEAFHRALVERTHDRLIAIWHRRAGKDDVLLDAMRTLALKDPGTYWHCFPGTEAGAQGDLERRERQHRQAPHLRGIPAGHHQADAGR